jgi:excisionase family DNA binding protein
MTNLISIAEAQERLSLSRSTITRMLDRGEIRRLNFGRAVRIPAEDIDALVQRARASE